jgi:hypothetical protein
MHGLSWVTLTAPELWVLVPLHSRDSLVQNATPAGLQTVRLNETNGLAVPRHEKYIFEMWRERTAGRFIVGIGVIFMVFCTI